jgi:hypothetical protein
MCSVIVEALKVDSLQRLSSSLEPLLRRIVSHRVTFLSELLLKWRIILIFWPALFQLITIAEFWIIFLAQQRNLHNGLVCGIDQTSFCYLESSFNFKFRKLASHNNRWRKWLFYYLLKSIYQKVKKWISWHC